MIASAPFSLLHRAATAGTRRAALQPLVQALQNHPAGQALRQASVPEAQRLLRAVAASCILQRGQWRPGAAPPISAPDDAPQLPQAAWAQALHELLPLEDLSCKYLALRLYNTRFVQRLLHSLRTAGQHVPHRLVLWFLQEGSRTRQLRPLVRPVLGTRGQWLARQKPAWAWALETEETEKAAAPECAPPGPVLQARAGAFLRAFLRQDRKGCWHLVPPRAFDPAWQQLGVHEALGENEGIPDPASHRQNQARHWWLLQLASRTPLPFWTQTLGMAPGTIHHWLLEQNPAWRPAVEMGWEHAAWGWMIDQHSLPCQLDADWLHVLRQMRWGEEWVYWQGRARAPALLARLSPTQREALWLEQLDSGFVLERWETFYLGGFLLQRASVGLALSAWLLQRLAGFLCGGQGPGSVRIAGQDMPLASLPQAPELSHYTVAHLAAVLHTSLLEDLAAIWPQARAPEYDPDGRDEWGELHRTLPAFLRCHALLQA